MTENIINSYTNEKVEDITDEIIADQLQSICKYFIKKKKIYEEKLFLINLINLYFIIFM